jgi:hypothetical protein
LAAGADERLLILECDGTLAAIEPGESGITSVQRLGRLIDLPTGPEFWDTERLVADGEATVAASDLRDRSDVGERMRATVARSVPGDEARLLLEVENATTLALALGREVVLVVLERGDRRRDAIVLELDTGLSGARPAG